MWSYVWRCQFDWCGLVDAWLQNASYHIDPTITVVIKTETWWTLSAEKSESAFDGKWSALEKDVNAETLTKGSSYTHIWVSLYKKNLIELLVSNVIF